jgi:hypothetical protein
LDTTSELVASAVALGKENRLDEAEALLRRAIESDPSSYAAHYNLGVALERAGKFDEAVERFRRAIDLRPDRAEPLTALSTALQHLQRSAEAIDISRRAVALQPDDAEAHGVLAQHLLRAGEFKRGWAEYEWRWKCESFKEPRRQFAKPRWNGSSLKGKTILLHHEQGFGDTIQFARYVPLLAARGAGVILHVPRELVRLLRRMPDVVDVVPFDDPAPTEFDVHAPLMSLPMLTSTTLKTIPANVPYLTSHRGASEEWERRLQQDGAKLRVGLAWAGRPTHPNDRQRSIPLESLAPLGDVDPGIVFYSLQKWDPESAANRPPGRMNLVNAARELNDFADTAALVENLDLVIAADTAVVHLAGAMAKKVWLLLPASPDFRWLLEREDSPWYPTMRLFRQERWGDWGEVIERVAAELAKFTRDD